MGVAAPRLFNTQHYCYNVTGSTHIVPDTNTPLSDEDTTPLPDNTPLTPCCDLDVSLTKSALLENLEAGEDPFNVFDVGPAIHNPVEPSLTFPPLQLPRPRWLVLSKDAGRQQHIRGCRTICIRDTRMYWQRSTTAVTLSQQSDLNLWCRQIYLFKWRWIAQNIRTLCCM